MRKYPKKSGQLYWITWRTYAIPGDTANSRHFKTETEEFMKFGDGDSRILWSAKLHPARSCQRDNRREWPYQRCRQPIAAILTGSTLFRAWCKAPEKKSSGSRTRTAPSAVLLGTKFLNSRLVRALVPLLWGAAPVRPIESELNSSWAKIADFQIQFWLVILVLVQDISYHILSSHILSPESRPAEGTRAACTSNGAARATAKTAIIVWQIMALSLNDVWDPNIGAQIGILSMYSDIRLRMIYVSMLHKIIPNHTYIWWDEGPLHWHLHRFCKSKLGSGHSHQR